MGGKIRAMAPPAAALAVAASALVAAFPGCTSSLHSTKVACTRAKVGGRLVCLRPGERCQSRHERVYRSYGVTCKDGRLRERSYIGKPNP